MLLVLNTLRVLKVNLMYETNNMFIQSTFYTDSTSLYTGYWLFSAISAQDETLYHDIYNNI